MKCIQCLKSPESHAGILINEKFSWYLSSFSFLHLNPIRFVSCFITVFSFIIFDTSECQHSHYLVIEKITFCFWKILFVKSLIFFLLNLHWNIYDIKNTEQLKQSLNTDWNVLTSSQENIKYHTDTDTGWKCSENSQISSQSLLSTNSASENCKILLEMIKLWKIHFPKKSLIYFPIQKVLINFSQRFIRCTNFKKKA